MVGGEGVSDLAIFFTFRLRFTKMTKSYAYIAPRTARLATLGRATPGVAVAT